MPEGELTKTSIFRAWSVNLHLLSVRGIWILDRIFSRKGEEATGGRKRIPSRSDALEALIGAIYIDGGFGARAKEFIHKFILRIWMIRNSL